MCQTRPRRWYARSMLRRLLSRVALGTGIFVALAGLGFVGCHHAGSNGDGGGGGGGGDGPDMAAPPYFGNCTAPPRPPSSVALQLVNAFPGRTFSAPLGIAQA